MEGRGEETRRPLSDRGINHTTRQSREKMISKDLLEILACPKCKEGLEYNKDKDILICRRCQAGFPITDGIPELLPERAEPLEP